MHPRLINYNYKQTSRRYICYAHKDLYDILVKHFPEGKEKDRALKLLEEAFDYGVRMNDKLIENHIKGWKKEVYPKRNKMIGIVSVKVNGPKRNPYTSEWVNKLANMVDKNMSLPHEHICLTDYPKGIDKRIKIIPIKMKNWYNNRGWWAKTECFNPKIQELLCERNLLLDLDSLITGNLDEMVNLEGDFLCAESTAPNFKPKGVITKYGSSIVIWDRGSRPQIYTELTKDIPYRLRGDQDWMAEILGEEKIIPKKYYQRLGGCKKDGPDKKTKVVFCVKPKNDVAAREFKWVEEIWK